jgi:transcription antitermination factor NusG
MNEPRMLKSQITPLDPPLLPIAAKWGAAHTKPRAEKVLAEFLKKRGIPYFLPLLRRKNVGHREIRWFQVPLFPGYVFVDTAAADRQVLFDSRKVAKVIETNDQVRLAAELGNVARALAADDRLLEARWAEVGKPVRIARGSLKGLTGEIVSLPSGTRLILRVHLISRAVCLEIDESQVEADL